LALDTETTGLDLHHGARPFLITFCDENLVNTYYEWDVDPTNRKVLASRHDLLEVQRLIDSASVLVLQNGKYDYKALRFLFQDFGLELRWDWGKFRDTLLAGHLLASNHPHDLTSMAMEFLGVNIEPLETRMKEAVVECRHRCPKGWRLARKGLPEMPSAKEGTWAYDYWLPRALALYEGLPESHPWWHITANYANGDSSTTLSLWKYQQKEITKRELDRIYDCRLRLIPAIVDIELRGMTVDSRRFDELEAKLNEEADHHHRRCLNLADREIEKLPVNGCSNDLKRVLFDKFKLQSCKKTPKGQPSTDKYVLDDWLATLPPRTKPLLFVESLRAYRKRKTALGYLDSYRKYRLPTRTPDTYSVFSSLNPTGTNTLRFSSENPNEQQISKQEDANLRYCFGPAEGREWWSLDYENIELRIPAYESNEQVMIELFERPDDPPYFGSYHLMNASIIYPDLFWPLAEEKGAFKKRYASTWYQWVKNFGFAMAYGAMEGSGTADRAAHKSGAQRLVMDRLKEHTKLNQKMVDLANRQGYVETIPDKTVDPTRGYPVLCSRARWGRVSPTVPLNYHVQSTAMWCTMKAMIRCSDYLSTLTDCYMVAQVHDEIVFDLPADGEVNLLIVAELKRLMEQSGEDIGVPLRVAASHHPIMWAMED
jgi:DNA polymerase I-like protein with 3'-5' exonuclease and polymerase domains